MKELLEQLGFKDDKGVYLPNPLKLWKKLYSKSSFDYSDVDDYDDYTNFITQPLTKGMFIPCDLEGNILVKPEPTDYDSDKYGLDVHKERLSNYQQAKERVLFEVKLLPSVYTDMEIMLDDEWTIEDAINNGVKLYLKPNQ